jgi:hypothetical protein
VAKIRKMPRDRQDPDDVAQSLRVGNADFHEGKLLGIIANAFASSVTHGK